MVAHVASAQDEESLIAKELQRRVLTEGRDGGFITFVDSRKGVETLAIASQQEEADLSEDPAVLPYRAGYDNEDRQRIEERLQSGSLRGIVSTSALEVGIDLPHLRVGFNLRVPATRKAYRQRLGRVGRSGAGAFVVIAPPDAFRRYGTSFQEYHEMSVEPSYLYLDNRFMQFAHGRCLADELDALGTSASLPTHIRWPAGFRDIYQAARPRGDRPPEFDMIAELGGDTPQHGYPLRSAGEVNFQIKRNENSDGFGELNQSQALREAYPGATYLHMAKAYKVAAWHTRTEPFILVKPSSPARSTQPRIKTWIHTGITSSHLMDGRLLRNENGFLAECHMQITERVEGFVDGSGQFHSYQDLRAHNPAMRARLRNFRTSGVVLCIEQDWFKKESVKTLFSDKWREVFMHEYSVLPQDVGSAATNISVHTSEGGGLRGDCVAVFDQTHGSLRITERLYVEFTHILDRLSVAAKADPEEHELELIIDRIREVFSDFSASPSPEGTGEELPEGYDLVFAKGSRVCLREQGQMAVDVEIIQPTIWTDGQLMYQVKIPPKPRQPPIRRWVSASVLEPSGDASSWDYASWNRQTEEYEDPPGDTES